MDRRFLVLCGATLAVLAAGTTGAAVPAHPRGAPPADGRALTAAHGAGVAPPAEAAKRVKRKAKPKHKPKRARKAKHPVRAVRRGAVTALAAPPGAVGRPPAGAEWAADNGLGVVNTGSVGDDEWDDYVALYGRGQTYVCESFGGALGGPVCTRNPQALQMMDAFNAQGSAVGSGHGGFGANGECLGFSSTSILFSLGASDPAWTGQAFPRAELVRRGGLSALTEESAAAIDDPALRAKALEQYHVLRSTVRERQLLQSSWTYQSWWEQWARAYGNLDGPTLYGLLSGPLGAGQTMGMGLFWTTAEGTGEGHELVARGVTGGPSRFQVSVYDPNYPLQPGPTIVVAGSQWWVENDPDALYPHSDRPQPLNRGGTTPTVLLLTQDQMTLRNPTAWWNGDRRGEPSPLIGQETAERPADRVYLQAGQGRIVQVTDERGRRALAPDGGPNSEPATAIPDALVRVGVEAPTTVILPRGPRYRVVVAGGPSGAAQLSVWDRRGVSRVTGQGRPGGRFVARVGGTPADLSATPGRGTTVGVGVVRRIGAGRFRSAEAAPALGGGLGQSEAAGPGAPREVGIALTGTGRVRVSADGARGPEVRLGTLGRHLYARVVKARTGAIGAGGALTVRPAWGDLRNGRIAATRTDPAGAARSAAVGGRVVRQRAIREVEASAAGGRVRWRVNLRRPAEVTVSVAFQRAGCCSTRRIFRGAAGSTALPAGLRAGDRVTLSVTAQDRENPFLLQTASRRLEPTG